MQSQNNYQSQGLKVEGQVQDLDHLRKMFIGGLSGVTTEDSLRSFYSQWGDVIDVVVMRDPTTKRSRGFGFITYSDASMVDKAQLSRPHVIDGKNVDSKRALPRPEGQARGETSVKKIFVGGLKENHDEQSLQDHFMQFGNVVNVKILTDKTTGRKRGFAFLEFDDYDAVDKAVLHKNHTIKYVLVDVKKSVYKQELAKKFTGPQQGGIMGPGFIGPGGYQQQPTQYNSQAQYGYAAQAPPNAYNGWGGYPQHSASGYQQVPAAAPQTGYNGWNSYTQQAGHWTQNGYNPANAAAAAVAAPAQSTQPANGWNGQQQNFGDYQQAYNGGPQKAGNLQGNRMNPYSVSSAPNYGI